MDSLRNSLSFFHDLFSGFFGNSSIGLKSVVATTVNKWGNNKGLYRILVPSIKRELQQACR